MLDFLGIDLDIFQASDLVEFLDGVTRLQVVVVDSEEADTVVFEVFEVASEVSLLDVGKTILLFEFFAEHGACFSKLLTRPGFFLRTSSVLHELEVSSISPFEEVIVGYVGENELASGQLGHNVVLLSEVVKESKRENNFVVFLECLINSLDTVVIERFGLLKGDFLSLLNRLEATPDAPPELLGLLVGRGLKGMEVTIDMSDAARLQVIAKESLARARVPEDPHYSLIFPGGCGSLA